MLSYYFCWVRMVWFTTLPIAFCYDGFKFFREQNYSKFKKPRDNQGVGGWTKTAEMVVLWARLKGSSRLWLWLTGSAPLSLICSAAGVRGWDLERIFVEFRTQPAFSELSTSGLLSVQSPDMVSCSDSSLYQMTLEPVSGVSISQRFVPRPELLGAGDPRLPHSSKDCQSLGPEKKKLKTSIQNQNQTKTYKQTKPRNESLPFLRIWWLVTMEVGRRPWPFWKCQLVLIASVGKEENTTSSEQGINSLQKPQSSSPVLCRRGLQISQVQHFAFVNKVLLEHNYAQSCPYHVWLLYHDAVAELPAFSREYMSMKPKHLLFGPVQSQFTNCCQGGSNLI